MILVSACLVGQSTRYDGRAIHIPQLLEYLGHSPYLALCPEVLGGLGIPRPPASIQGGRPGREGRDVLEGRARVMESGGRDVSQAFIKGAGLVAQAALKAGVKRCFLKDRSPSCAWDPQGENPEGGPGQGVLSALLLSHGLEVKEIRPESFCVDSLKQPL